MPGRDARQSEAARTARTLAHLRERQARLGAELHGRRRFAGHGFQGLQSRRRLDGNARQHGLMRQLGAAVTTEKKMDLNAWLEERAANCRRIADGKQGEDRAGWLEDAAYFDAAREAAEGAARWKRAAEANIGENVELRQLLQNMEAARDAALRLKVERQPELGRIADALCEYNERDDQDAGRYRWLRKHAAARLRRIAQDLTWMQSARGTDGKLNVAHPEIQAMLDEEIDNAMAAQADANKTPNVQGNGPARDAA